MVINFIEEFNAMQRYARNNSLSGRERLLWTALFVIANDRAVYDTMSKQWDFPSEFIPIATAELTLNSTLDKRGIENVRNSLKQRGIIDFIPGLKNKKPPMYRLIYQSVVGNKNVPNTVPNDVPNMTPDYAPTCPQFDPYLSPYTKR